MNFGLLEGFCPVAPEGAVEGAICFVAEWEVPIFVVLLVGIVLGVRHLLKRRHREKDGRFILPINTSARIQRDLGMTPEMIKQETERQREDMRRALSPLEPSSRSNPPAALAVRESSNRPGGGNGAPSWPSAAIASPATASAPAAPVPSAVDGEVPEGTLQLLPGRLEVVRGPRQGEEIRFVRVPGKTPEITLGRLEGPPHQHVRLDSPTVSRRHARLQFREGTWRLRNESSTNPTIYNGEALGSEVEEVALEDGDRIEVGEVLLEFHQDGPTDRLPARSSWYTDRGRRSVNQDAVVIRSLPNGREFAAVCDGMGSHAEGGVASHLAIESLVQSLSEGMALGAAVEEANRAVLAAANNSADRIGMGTTLVAVLREGDRYQIANVGDSRAYRIAGGTISQVSRDHSFVAEAISAGRMTAEEAGQSPWKNAVTRSLGTDDELEVDVFGPFDANEPAIVLLCTDGVHGMLEAEDILMIVRDAADIGDVARSLSEAALVEGGEDNVAVAAIRFGPDGSAPNP